MQMNGHGLFKPLLQVSQATAPQSERGWQAERVVGHKHTAPRTRPHTAGAHARRDDTPKREGDGGSNVSLADLAAGRVNIEVSCHIVIIFHSNASHFVSL